MLEENYKSYRGIYVINSEEFEIVALREFICCGYISYDVDKFREWDNFEYYFDTSHCEKHPQF